MKKTVYAILFFTLLLTACHSSELSIQEIQKVPNKVQDAIHSDHTLQRLSDGGKNTYIVFHSTGTVTAELKIVDNILNIEFQSEPQENQEKRPYVYKLNRGDANYDTVRVLVNGNEKPFDNSTGF